MNRLLTVSTTMRLRLVFVAGALVSVAACTAVQFSYNNANSLIRFMARDYADLDAGQSEALQRQVARLQEWHRGTELPEYVHVLQSARARVSHGVARQDIDWAVETLRNRYRRFAVRAAEEAAPLLASLSEDQIESIEAKFAKDNTKFAKEWLNGSPGRRERHASDRMIERFEEWTGRLNAAQQVRIQQFVHDHPRSAEMRLEERRRWQEGAIQLVREHRREPDELAARLGALFVDREAGRSAEYARETRRWESDLVSLIFDIDKSLEPEQHNRVLRRMDRYAEDFAALTRGPRMTQQSAASNLAR